MPADAPVSARRHRCQGAVHPVLPVRRTPSARRWRKRSRARLLGRSIHLASVGRPAGTAQSLRDGGARRDRHRFVPAPAQDVRGPRGDQLRPDHHLVARSPSPGARIHPYDGGRGELLADIRSHEPSKARAMPCWTRSGSCATRSRGGSARILRLRREPCRGVISRHLGHGRPCSARPRSRAGQ